MQKYRIFIFIILMGIFQSFFFSGKKTTYTVGFYNVENLFDTIRNTNINDADFTPDGKNHWDSKKYNIKLNNLSRVILGLGYGNAPAIVGMAEVENRQVLEDLIKTKNLAGKKYAVIHRNSKDERGIDVAAIYRTDVLKDLKYEYLEVVLPDKDDFTREILYVKASMLGKYAVNIFYNHWPSRREGEAESEPKRIAAAKVLKAKIEEIKKKDANAVVFVMGDFNDEPNNKSIAEVLGAGKPGDKTKSLVNMSYAKFENKEGTHSFKGEWNMLDQVMVSRSFYEKTKGLTLVQKETGIFKEPYVLFKHKDGGISPNKSYSGPQFHAKGYSDHLAVYFSLEVK
ncbi:MAG TPA: hypothetical protein VK177_00475 [Flavobacteriales bacterium]|nr:hypothetical protein [Flavobacteriales bacterium]